MIARKEEQGKSEEWMTGRGGMDEGTEGRKNGRGKGIEGRERERVRWTNGR